MGRPRGCTSNLFVVTNTPRAPGASAMGLIGGNSFGFATHGHATASRRTARAGNGEPIDQLLTDGPTEEELRRAKAQYERHWLHELARVDSRADALGEYATLHGDPHLINSRIAEIDAPVRLRRSSRCRAGWLHRRPASDR